MVFSRFLGGTLLGLTTVVDLSVNGLASLDAGTEAGADAVLDTKKLEFLS